MAKNIRGNQDGKNGENQSYTVPGRGEVSRPKMVREVKQGKHENHSIYTREGVEYVRAKPDLSKGNNVDK
ncbi:DUF3892 domain-containing protein [Vibrio cyclitrophicus]|uniref:DUF3892 domain-containing protein n=1 Tax=Vibrio cyclitrophicus TaxID=47951 RepID=UPI000C82D09C|nr:DUF3892 domain-containing protein [Vibrio cyclitrophicus]PMF61375.1 DUF3892 domain-containing protein [Vibrio cyclitrophicus]